MTNFIVFLLNLANSNNKPSEIEVKQIELEQMEQKMEMIWPPAKQPATPSTGPQASPSTWEGSGRRVNATVEVYALVQEKKNNYRNRCFVPAISECQFWDKSLLCFNWVWLENKHFVVKVFLVIASKQIVSTYTLNCHLFSETIWRDSVKLCLHISLLVAHFRLN